MKYPLYITEVHNRCYAAVFEYEGHQLNTSLQANSANDAINEVKQRICAQRYHLISSKGLRPWVKGVDEIDVIWRKTVALNEPALVQSVTPPRGTTDL